MVVWMEECPGLLFKGVFGLPGTINLGPDFEEDFTALFSMVLFLAGMCYLSALCGTAPMCVLGCALGGLL